MEKPIAYMPPELLKATNLELQALKERYREDIKLREERIDELVRSLKDLQEAYEQLVAERERMLKKSLRVQKVKCGLYTFIYRTKHLVEQDLYRLGFERGDELRLVIVKTPLAQIIKH